MAKHGTREKDDRCHSLSEDKEALFSRVALHGGHEHCSHKLLSNSEESDLKQARWQYFVAELYIKLEYKPGRTNNVADALSKKA